MLFPWRQAATIGVLTVVFIAIMSAGLVLAPDPVRSENAAGAFDASAAHGRLERLLQAEEPHPVDSAANDAVRTRLLQEITSLGFSPEVQDAFTCRPRPNAPSVECARVRNVLFSIGPADAPIVLAASHYDSVAAAPGASDDGLGVAVWLEIARMLADEPLHRRLLFLFSDGEEQALLGAYAFAENDPRMRDVDALVNLESRGSRGLALFFESNLPNADAVAAYGAVARPAANSVMADVYRLLPNSTDVTVLTRPGLDVVNIALLDGLEDYHTPQDSLASLDRRSIQHMGDTALAVTRRLATSRDADHAKTLAYTDIASRLFVAAPVWLVLAALVFSVAAGFAAFWRLGAEGRWRAFAAPPLAVLCAAGFAFAADCAIRLARPGEDYAFAHPEPTRAWCVLLAMLAVLLTLAPLRRARPPLMGAAGMFWFALIGALASIVANGISILFALPALAYALGWLVSLAWQPAERIGRWLAALVVLIVWAPTLHLVELALGYETPFVFAILTAAMLLPGLGPLAAVQGEARRRAATGVIAMAALVALIAALVAPSRSEARPQALNLSYFVNSAEGEARVLGGAADRALPPELRAGFAPELLLPGDRVETWAMPAPMEPIAAPELSRLSVATENERRIVRGRLAMNGVYRATLRIPVETEPLRMRLNGVEVDFADTGGERRDFVSIACQGRACDGAEIEIILGAEVERDWYIIGQTPGARVAAAEAVRAHRPAATSPIQMGDSAITLTRFRPDG